MLGKACREALDGPEVEAVAFVSARWRHGSPRACCWRHAVLHCPPMSPTVVHRCPPLSTAVHRCPPLSIAVHRCLPLSTAVHCCTPPLLAQVAHSVMTLLKVWKTSEAGWWIVQRMLQPRSAPAMQKTLCCGVLVWRAGGTGAARWWDDGERGRRWGVVESSCTECNKFLAHALRRKRVQPRGRLIQEDQLGLHHQLDTDGCRQV